MLVSGCCVCEWLLCWLAGCLSEKHEVVLSPFSRIQKRGIKVLCPRTAHGSVESPGPVVKGVLSKSPARTWLFSARS